MCETTPCRRRSLASTTHNTETPRQRSLVSPCERRASCCLILVPPAVFSSFHPPRCLEDATLVRILLHAPTLISHLALLCDTPPTPLADFRYTPIEKPADTMRLMQPDVYRLMPPKTKSPPSPLVAEYQALLEGGLKPAAYIIESIIYCGRQVFLPEGYVCGMFELTRQHGGLTIADEVSRRHTRGHLSGRALCHERTPTRHCLSFCSARVHFGMDSQTLTGFGRAGHSYWALSGTAPRPTF